MEQANARNWKRNIILFLSSQAISLFGSSLVQYAITWYITLQTKSGTAMMISILCGFLPTFFISPFAGVWADRYNRKLLIMLSDSFIAAATLTLAILFFAGYDSMWMLYVALALRAVGSGIQSPAISAFLPQLVPVDQLTKVNAANSTIHSLSTLLSPMLSAALLAMASIEAIFLIDVVTAAIAVSILFAFLRVPAHARAQKRQSTGYLTDLREGFRYVKSHSYVRKAFILFGYFFLFVTPVAFLTPLQVTRSFGSDVWRLSALEITYSAGMIAGGIFIGWWGGFRNRIHTMAMSSIVIGICTTALGITPNFIIYLFFMTVIGISMPVFNTPSNVILQEKIEGDYLGRVFSVLSMISSTMMPIGMLLFGPLADTVKIEWLLIGTGVLLSLQGVFFLADKDLVEAGCRTPKPESDSVAIFERENLL